MKNPFQYGKVAEKENFIDRDADREYLKNALYSGTNVILMSPRRWGKSSLVKRSMNELQSEHPEVKVVYIDAFPITSSREFYGVFAREVLKATSSHIEAAMDSIGRFLKNLAPKISFSPEPMSQFSLSLELRDDIIDEDEVLSLPERIAKEKGFEVIVCIDEFQRLARLHDYERLESKMRSIWQHQQEVSYCLYGSQRHMMTEIFNSPEKPFYRFGQMYHLKKIDKKYWIEYIIERFRVTGKSIDSKLASEITEVTECHSWYVQQLSSAVWNFTDKIANSESAAKGLSWCIDVNSETYQQIFDRLTDSQIGLLRAIAMHETKLTSAETLKKYHLGTSSAVIKNKRMLAKEDIIICSRTEGARFLDPILRLWFKENYLSEL